MEIKLENNDKGGFFEAVDSGIQLGKLSYSWVDTHTLSADGTEVNNEFGGRGVGKRLVMAMVDYARENDLKIIPKCPFVVALFDRLTSIQDVLASNK